MLLTVVLIVAKPASGIISISNMSILANLSNTRSNLPGMLPTVTVVLPSAAPRVLVLYDAAGIIDCVPKPL